MATEDARKLFVAGLPESITEDVLRQLFEATGGKVVEVSLPRERTTGKVRGFGFVTFATSDEANRARDELDGSLQAGRSISVRPFSSEPPKRGEGREGGGGGGRFEAPSAQGSAEDRTLYVGNLPYDTSQQELTQFLEENGVGPVARIHLPVGPDGRMRGFGFVTMANAEAANAALAALRNADVRGRRLMINIAHPRSERPPGGGPGGDRSRPPPRDAGPRYPTEPPMNFEGGGASMERRRTVPPEGEGGDDRRGGANKKKKAKGASTGRAPEHRERGGGGNWKSKVEWDDED
jgi:RNA recognition motif-containing protein